VLLTGAFPLNMRYLSSTQSQGYVEADLDVTNLYYFYLDELAVNAGATIAVAFSAFKPGLSTNRLDVSGFELDLNQANGISSLPITVSSHLAIVRTQNSVVLSWPTNASGFRLESRSSLSSPTTWIPVTNKPAVSADQYKVTNSVSGLIQLYRLGLQ
jgi:hypothetical protein